MNKLLTICIPTYNRSTSLEVLIASICAQLDADNELANQVQVIVSDNASSDSTSEYLKLINKRYLKKIIQEFNLGSTENIKYCFSVANTAYVWIVGDDDLIIDPMIELMIQLLKKEKPDMICLKPKFLQSTVNIGRLEVQKNLIFRIYGRDNFIKRTNHAVTFISAVIFKKEIINGSEIRKLFAMYSDTFLPSLIWALLVIKRGEKFIYVNSPEILATTDQTSSYPAMRTFGVDYPNIASSVFGEQNKITELYKSKLVIDYLPGLMWTCRVGASKYGRMDGYKQVEDVFKNYFWFKVFVYPIAKAPIFLASATYNIFRVARKIRHLFSG